MGLSSTHTALLVFAGIAILSVVIFLVVYLMKKHHSPKNKLPGLCTQIRHGRQISRRAANPVPKWFVAWTAPSQGTGPGYTVTYSGSVDDSSGQAVYSFKTLTEEGFTLPDTTPAGTYKVNIMATNQLGDGPVYSQDITLANHAPKFSGEPQVIWGPKQNQTQQVSVIMLGSFPDVPQTPFNNGQPGSYSVTWSLMDSEGKVIPTTTDTWVVENTATAAGYAPIPTPGEVYNISISVCNYDMCAASKFKYTVPGSPPNQSSSVTARFGTS